MVKAMNIYETLEQDVSTKKKKNKAGLEYSNGMGNIFKKCSSGKTFEMFCCEELNIYVMQVMSRDDKEDPEVFLNKICFWFFVPPTRSCRRKLD